MYTDTRFLGPLPLHPWRRAASEPQLWRVAPPSAAGRVGRSNAIPDLESGWSAEAVLFSKCSIGASEQLRSRLGRSHCVIAPKAHLHRDWPTDDSPAKQTVPSSTFARLRNDLLGGPSLALEPPNSQGLCGSVCKSKINQKIQRPATSCRPDIDRASVVENGFRELGTSGGERRLEVRSGGGDPLSNRWRLRGLGQRHSRT